jgi:uncharacterized repeat protein (TIGR03803 family)
MLCSSAQNQLTSLHQNNRISSAASLSLRLFCLLGFFLCAAIASPAQTLTTLASFDFTNGDYPFYGSLVEGPNGSYYGTTLEGGTYGFGTVFEITTAGTLTSLYSFCSPPNCTDGGQPYGGLVLDSDGNFYGVTAYSGGNGAGTVFKISTSGKLTTLYTFCSQTNCADGGSPQAGLASSANGVLFGTTSYGGTNFAGTIFRITPAGKLTTLYNFCSKPNCADGSYVQSPLTLATNGNYYGATESGGANNWGTVFEVTPEGEFTTLHSFSFIDGAAPVGGLVQASDGNLYGTTNGGGKSNNGTVFKITKAGKLTTIYNFCVEAYCADGDIPFGTLIQGSNGNLYGTTFQGGTGYHGTVFEMTTAGDLKTLHSFVGTDGASPFAGVVEGSNGDLYGTTYQGGDYNCSSPPLYGCGTVFSLTQ